ncbi:MAG: hypothetical protein LBU32_03030 [Clostridiales bacterium]|nr:hypothetical protein [Clostridiales bacterium]
MKFLKRNTGGRFRSYMEISNCGLFTRLTSMLAVFYLGGETQRYGRFI